MPVRTTASPMVLFEDLALPSAGVDALAEEEPLRVKISGRDLGILLRTPGEDAALAVGHAVGEGLVAGPDDLDEVRFCPAPQREEQLNVVEVLLSPDAPGRTRLPATARLVASGCGLCGRSTVEAVLANRPAPPAPVEVPAVAIARMAAALEARQEGFRRTGGLHAAGLFERDGTLVFAAEDVGRHNAVDKVVGAALLAGRWPPPPLLMVTSRGSFEIVQKAVRAGLGLAAFVSAPTSLAVELARAAGICLVAFVRPGRFKVFAGRDVISQGEPP